MRLLSLHALPSEFLSLSSDLPPGHRRLALEELEQNPHLARVMSLVLTESVDALRSYIGGAPQCSTVHG